MMSRICLFNAHPDPSQERFCFALTDAYQQEAEAAGHTVDRFDLGALDVPLLDRAADFRTPPPDPLQPLQAALGAADHLTLIYPLWLGSLPAKAKAVLEHLARGGFFLDAGEASNNWPTQKMKGKSARLIVTMGMPGLAYRLFFGAHSLKGLEAGMLRISGFKPVRHTIFGGVELSPQTRARMLDKTRALGARAM